MGMSGTQFALQGRSEPLREAKLPSCCSQLFGCELCMQLPAELAASFSPVLQQSGQGCLDAGPLSLNQQEGR